MKQQVGSQAFNSIIEGICERAEIKESEQLTSLKRKVEELENDLAVLVARAKKRFQVDPRDVCPHCGYLTSPDIDTSLHKHCKKYFDEPGILGLCHRIVCVTKHEEAGLTDFDTCLDCLAGRYAFRET